MHHKCLHHDSEKIFIAKHIGVCVVLPDCDLAHEFNGLSSFAFSRLRQTSKTPFERFVIFRWWADLDRRLLNAFSIAANPV